MEVNAGMDIVKFRKLYPRLQIQGGIDKVQVALGRNAIDKELDSKVPTMIRSGGYIPYFDHAVPEDVSWENFKYYRQRLQDIIQRTPCGVATQRAST
jgi:uroporphyrinogen decarboxylase